MINVFRLSILEENLVVKGIACTIKTRKKIYVSKDVTFEEEKSWPWGIENQNDLVQVVFPFVADSLEEVEENGGQLSSDSREEYDKATPLSHASTSRLNPDHYDDSIELKKRIPLSDIYNDTKEMVMDEELYLMGTEEPANFRVASEEKN